MRTVLLAFLSFCFLITSCKEDKVSEVIVETQEQIDAKKISQKDIESIRYDDFGLSTDSQKAVADWQKFQELNTQIELLKKGDLVYFSGDPLIVKTLLQELRTQMPVNLKTKIISTRKGENINNARPEKKMSKNRSTFTSFDPSICQSLCD